MRAAVTQALGIWATEAKLAGCRPERGARSRLRPAVGIVRSTGRDMAGGALADDWVYVWADGIHSGFDGAHLANGCHVHGGDWRERRRQNESSSASLADPRISVRMKSRPLRAWHRGPQMKSLDNEAALIFKRDLGEAGRRRRATAGLLVWRCTGRCIRRPGR